MFDNSTFTGLAPTDLIPPDDEDLDADTAADDAAYARDAKSLNTDSLMLIVAERFSDSPALRTLVEDTKRVPFVPGDRRTLHISDAMRLGAAIAALLADAMDEQLEIISAAAVQGVR